MVLAFLAVAAVAAAVAVAAAAASLFFSNDLLPPATPAAEGSLGGRSEMPIFLGVLSLFDTVQWVLLLAAVLRLLLLPLLRTPLREFKRLPFSGLPWPNAHARSAGVGRAPYTACGSALVFLLPFLDPDSPQ